MVPKEGKTIRNDNLNKYINTRYFFYEHYDRSYVFYVKNKKTLRINIFALCGLLRPESNLGCNNDNSILYNYLHTVYCTGAATISVSTLGS